MMGLPSTCDNQFNVCKSNLYVAYLKFCSAVKDIPWTARRSNQSILKEISPEYSLEGLMLKLKL